MTAVSQTKSYESLLNFNARAALARRNLKEFILYTKSDYHFNWHHEAICGKLDDFARGRIKKLMIFVPPQHGKLLPIDTPIFTPNGWRQHGHLKPGDYVFGHDGKPKKVLANSGSYDWPVQQLKFQSGYTIRSAKEHLWKLMVEYDDHKGRREIITDTQSIFKKRHRRNPSIHVAPALEMAYKDLPIDPYVLGCWLGDGHQRQGVMTVGNQDILHFSKLGSERLVKKGIYRVLISGLTTKLRKVGLYKNKHIPVDYLTSSIEQRKCLLQGLMDTDGCVDTRGNCEFAQKQGALAHDVYYLIRSLGIKARKYILPMVLNGRIVGEKVRICFNPDSTDGIFRLPRKRDRLVNKSTFDRDDKKKFFLQEIEDYGLVQGNCIEVEGGMYLAGEDMIPTHNSELSTRRFPAYALGLNPNLKIAICSYSATIASNFNRDIQRIIDDKVYEEIFPETSLNENSAINPSKNTFLRNSETFEIIGHTGFVKTVGVGGSLTGTPVDIGIIDDPFKDRQEAMSGTIREKVWSWYTDVFETRLHNDSKQLVIMCMAGSTPVLMSDGTEKNLKDIQVGDTIATYDNGRLATSEVLGWKNQGLDFVYEIRMRSGILVKANERHPFLVCKNGITKWKRLKNLRPGDEIVRMMPNGEHTKVSSAMNVINPQHVRDIVAPITIKQDGPQDSDQHHLQRSQDEQRGYATGMELAWVNSIRFLKSKTAGVQYAANCLLKAILGPIGMESCVLTTATKQVRLEDYYVTTVTLPSDTEKLSKSYIKQQNIYDFVPDTIEEIVPAGREDVFDIQVERTENFIANGLVSHNTRWDEDDLAGRILKRDKDWEVIRFPAIKKRESPDDPREIGEALWPEKHSLERIQRVEENTPVTFNSLYQQEPSAPKDLLVFPEWVEIEEMPGYTQYFGGDFGYPTAICEVQWHGKNLYLSEVMYDETDPTNSQIAASVKALGYNLSRPYVWDSAEPRSIKDLKTNKENPMNAIEAIKGPDSISYGITTIKEFKIHVTKHSNNLKRELLHYQWMTHKGKKTDQAIDEFNHLMDCIRYVLGKFYKAPSKNSGLGLSFHR